MVGARRFGYVQQRSFLAGVSTEEGYRRGCHPSACLARQRGGKKAQRDHEDAYVCKKDAGHPRDAFATEMQGCMCVYVCACECGCGCGHEIVSAACV